MLFSEIDFVPEIQERLKEIGFVECTPVQNECIPHIQQGHDVAGLAQTGTGKTAAFLLPLMDRILRAKKKMDGKAPDLKAFPQWEPQNFILVLVPTRELAEQVYQNVHLLGQGLSISAVAIIGGVSYDNQKRDLKNSVQFIVATPGRLIDLYKEHFIDLRQIKAVVFDEADRMFDMGFKDDMKYILRRIPKNRQFLVFSATLNFDVLNVAYQFGANPVECNISRDQAKAENVKDILYHVGKNDKPKFILSLLKKEQPRQTIIFSNFKHQINSLTQFLNDNGLPAVGISSLLSQAQRTRVMNQFKGESPCNILVATDVAARGLDIKGVDVIINFELPDDPENYVHRIGRTGRAGAIGQAYSLVCDDDVHSLMRIEEYLKHKIEVGWLEDKDLIKEYIPFGKPTPKPFQHNKEFPKKERGFPHREKKNHIQNKDFAKNKPFKKTAFRENHSSHANKDGRIPYEHRDRQLGRHGPRQNKLPSSHTKVSRFKTRHEMGTNNKKISSHLQLSKKSDNKNSWFQKLIHFFTFRWRLKK